jgi:excisionase family DNA binding protein
MPKKPTLQPGKDAEPVAVRVSVSEAARLFGVNPRTVRRAMAASEIRYIVVRGRYAIHFESLVRWSQRQTTIMNKRNTKGIGQWIDQWKIRNPKFSPHPPSK